MNERLIKLMDVLEYTPSVFADEVGVIRSSISHIMSGRNKPGVELLQKVLKRFPEVSAEWLLAGLGPMFRDGQRPNVNSSPKREPVKEQMETGKPSVKGAEQTNLLGYLESIQQPGGHSVQPMTVSEPEPVKTISQQEPALSTVLASAQPGARPAESVPGQVPYNKVDVPGQLSNPAPGPQPTVNQAPQPEPQGSHNQSVDMHIALPGQKEKLISRIVIYYNDKTYQEFRATD
jgi:hypothetical protein